MKRILFAVVFLFLMFACPSPVLAEDPPPNKGKVKMQFGPALQIPKSLDQLYLWMDTGYNLYKWDNCLPGALQKPYISWAMVTQSLGDLAEDNGQQMVIIPANDIAEIIKPGGGKFPTKGIVRISENEVYGLMIAAAFDNPGTLSCSSTRDGKPTVYGPGVQRALDWLVANRLYER